MSKIHVLPDENLGGVLREYVEVDRIAKVGDYATKDGYIRKVSSRDTLFGGTVEFDEYYKDEAGDDVCGWADGYYKTIEPTDIVHIDGKRYRLVDREAKVGERIIIVNGYGWYRDKVGYIYDVIHPSKYDFEGNDNSEAYVEYEKNAYCDVIHFVRRGNYRVLEHVEPTEIVTYEEGDDKSILDLLANLARRMTELERRLTETNKSQESSETHIFDVIHRIQNEIDGMYDKYREVDDKIEMILDDIVTLDERTRPLLALIKAVKDDG